MDIINKQNSLAVSRDDMINKLVDATVKAKMSGGMRYDKETKERLKKGFDKSSKNCILCGKQSYGISQFFANGGKHGIPKGKVRAFVYGLCRKCGSKKNSNQKIEDRLFSVNSKNQESKNFYKKIKDPMTIIKSNNIEIPQERFSGHPYFNSPAFTKWEKEMIKIFSEIKIGDLLIDEKKYLKLISVVKMKYIGLELDDYNATKYAQSDVKTLVINALYEETLDHTELAKVVAYIESCSKGLQLKKFYDFVYKKKDFKLNIGATVLTKNDLLKYISEAKSFVIHKTHMVNSMINENLDTDQYPDDDLDLPFENCALECFEVPLSEYAIGKCEFRDRSILEEFHVVHCLLVKEILPKRYISIAFESKIETSKEMDSIGFSFGIGAGEIPGQLDYSNIVKNALGYIKKASTATETTKINLKKKISGKKKTFKQINEIIHIIPKKIKKHLKIGISRPVDWSHRWDVMGHWRQVPKGIGKNRNNERVVTGFTWVNHYVKGPKEASYIKKTRIIGV